MTTKIFSISGMTCASCVNHVQQDVGILPGIHHAVVNFATSKMDVMFDEKQVSVEDIIKAVAGAGYEAALIGGEVIASEHSGHKMDHGEDHAQHAGSDTNIEVRSKLRKVIFGSVVSVALIMLVVAVDVPNEMIVMMLATLAVLLYTAKEFYVRGIPIFLKRGRPNMDTLVALGVSAAFLYSSYVTLFTTQHEEYFMDASLIATFIMLGRYLEAKAKGSASAAIKKLLELGAKVAHRVVGENKTEDVQIEDIQTGDILLVKAGEKIPTDGVIVQGDATIDESMVTGESIPVEKHVDDVVIGATINGNTTITMRVTKIGRETMLAQMVRLVEQAQMSKAPIQKLVDVISSYFVWVVIGISVLTFSGWLWFGASVSMALITTVAVLIIACPCALGLATPIAIVVGSGKGAEMGILLKRAESLEHVQKITTIVFDKTGTITEGRPTLTGIVAKDEQRALQLAASLGSQSAHSLDVPIVGAAEDRKIVLRDVQKSQDVAGRGVVGTIDGMRIALGNEKLMEQEGISIDAHAAEALQRARDNGETVMLLSEGESVLGVFSVADTVKESSKRAVELLHAAGIKTVLLTGDHKRVGEVIAKQVGIDEVLAEVSPEQKVEKIKMLQKSGAFVAMVGDGINDAPALATADIGIAMGTGTDVAIESGDIVLVKGDLLKAVEAIALSKHTLRVIKQNLFWAFIYNTVGIPIAAFGLLNPIVSAVAMAFSSVSVVLNALRLKRFRV